MRQNTVLQFIPQLYRKPLDPAHPFPDHLDADHNMPQELSCVRIIICRERRQFIYLSDIMAHGCRIQKVRIQRGIRTHIIFTQSGNTQRMLQQPSYESMMNTLGRTAELKGLHKCGILHENAPQKPLQIRALYPVYKTKQFPVHSLNILVAYRKIIRRIIFSLLRLTHSLHIQLNLSLKTGHIRHNIHIVQTFKCLDPSGIRIPDLGVCCSRLILKNNIFISFPGFCQSCLSGFAQIDAGNTLALPQSFDVFHSVSPILPILIFSVLQTSPAPDKRFYSDAGRLPVYSVHWNISSIWSLRPSDS